MLKYTSSFITEIINFSLENGCFPDELKLADVSPRLVSILSHESKVFERIMYMQIDTFMRDELSKQALVKIIAPSLKRGKVHWTKVVFLLFLWTFQTPLTH